MCYCNIGYFIHAIKKHKIYTDNSDNGKFVCGIPVLFTVSKKDNVPNYLPASAAVCFAIAITQKKANRFRMFGLVNLTLWIVYDVCIPIPSANVLVHLGIAISTLIGMIRLYGLFGIVKQKREE